MERYCPGPEVDVNFVLFDGEVMFSDVCDDFPKIADVNGPSITSQVNTFIELNSTFPSALPPGEIDVLRNSFHGTLSRLGLWNGIMHLEGRVDHSSVSYQTKDGVLDIYAHPTQSDTAQEQQPTAWLHEINPRPPGMKGTQIVESTHGVDYWGLGLLIALRDKQRVRTLSYPFKNGPQYSCVMVFIPANYPVSYQGIFDSDDICAEFLLRRPDLEQHISRCGYLVKRGDVVPHPSSGIHRFLAYFNVFSRRRSSERK